MNQTITAVRVFNEAFNQRNIDGVMKLMTDDAVFENSSGGRFEGQEAIRTVLIRSFELMSTGSFNEDTIFACADRCVVLWTYFFNKENPEQGQIRGVDVFRMRDDKVSEKFSYIKSKEFVDRLGIDFQTR